MMLLAAVVVGGLLLPSERAPAPPQETAPTQTPGQEAPAGSEVEKAPQQEPGKNTWNEYDLKILTFKWGIGNLIDWGTGFENRVGASQVAVPDDIKIRDFRLTFSGKLNLERSITYRAGLMYDGPNNRWLVREAGLQFGIPELWGNVFIGRQKVGVSLNKIMVGYAGWTMERMPMSDATIPILTDGIKWLGVHPSKRANWNAGFYINSLPTNPSTDRFDIAAVARFALLPIREAEDSTLLHLAAGYYWGRFRNHEAQLRSRPGSSTAPFFVDTGVFPADLSHLFSLESYLQRPGWLFGAEYLLNPIRTPNGSHPFFHGGEIFAAWILTGESRRYEDIGGKLGFLIPKSSAFDGGTGAVELVFHLSYTDLDSGPIQGGRFWRLTPQVNWYLDSRVRLELNSGLGRLHRFGETGLTLFLQARLQVYLN